MADQFYDTTNLVRHDLHRAFIRQCLDNFAGNTGVIQLIAAEFTGPLHFVQFWVDNIRQWEDEKGKKETIGLSVTKDVQDSILADPARSAAIDVIDIRYWYYQANGEVYAPKGGERLAPRQHERLLHPKRSSFAEVYHAVRDYRDRYPEKAILYSADGCDEYGWAVFVAGGSLANIPRVADDRFLTAAASMKPADGVDQGARMLAEKGKGYILYIDKPGKVKLDLSGEGGTYRIRRIRPATGAIAKEIKKVRGGRVVELPGADKGPVVIWLERD